MSDDGQPPLKKRKSSLGPDEATYANFLKACSVIATPMAYRKQVKKLYKLVRKASIEGSARDAISGEGGGKKKGIKTCTVRRGVKEVVKGIRKGAKGICVIAGDISPIDVIMHIPTYCEECGVAYMFVPSKAGLGAACATKRPTSCVLITPSNSGRVFSAMDLFDEVKAFCLEAVRNLPNSGIDNES